MDVLNRCLAQVLVVLLIGGTEESQSSLLLLLIKEIRKRAGKEGLMLGLETKDV